MSSIIKRRFSFLQLATLLAIFSLPGMWIAAAEDPFVEEFTGPELDPSWIILDNEGDTHEGFTEDGEYEIVDSQSTADAGLAPQHVGIGRFYSRCHFETTGLLPRAKRF